MSNQVRQVEKVADIIKVLKGGINFYEDALDKVQGHGVKTTFGRMLRIKREAVEKLQPFAIAEQGEVENSTSFSVDARKMYTKILSAVSPDSDHTFVDQLEEVEDKTLEVIKDALEEDQPTACNQALLNILADAQVVHDQMKSLQQTTA